VSHTTRKPREGEIDGKHYHFCSKDRIESDIAAGRFLEHARVHGNIYGTSWRAVDDVRRKKKVWNSDV
jgi:guanylate kinase